MKMKKLSGMFQRLIAIFLTVIMLVFCSISGVYADDGEGTGTMRWTMKPQQTGTWMTGPYMLCSITEPSFGQVPHTIRLQQTTIICSNIPRGLILPRISDSLSPIVKVWIMCM